MKKIMGLLVVLCLLTNVMTGCGTNYKSENSLSIVTTIFPAYDWVRQILGNEAENAEITLLLDSGADLHSYQPTADDIVKISACDIFIYVGGHSDGWVQDVLARTDSKDRVVINLMEVLGNAVKQEEIVSGMEHDHEHEHDDISEENITDRSLAEFNGEWQSIYPLLLDGTLDKFLEQQAAEDVNGNADKETMREKYRAIWACDVSGLKIAGNSISFIYADGTTTTAEYTYAGYSIEYADDGCISGVRYQFETASEDAPKYIQLDDHNHESSETEHFHIYFGNESFDKLLHSETTPYFIKADLTDEEIIECLIDQEYDKKHEDDEHIWLSLKNAEIICRALSQELSVIAPEHAETYAANTEAYCEKLAVLDQKYKSAVDEAPVDTLLFADRFPFRYLTDDYGIEYYAAFSGCSAESEASFETVIFLAGKLDELKLSAVLTIEGSDRKLAQTIINASSAHNAKILTINSMQSITSKDVKNGSSYLSIMESNLEVLKEALQ